MFSSYLNLNGVKGIYEVSVEAWTSDGNKVTKHLSRTSDMIVKEDEGFDAEGYELNESKLMSQLYMSLFFMLPLFISLSQRNHLSHVLKS